MTAGVDFVIPCPYCQTPSFLWTSRDPRTGKALLDHDCPRCGPRTVEEEQMALGWARYEAMEGCARLEPLYRHDGQWFGKFTGQEYDLPEVPEDACDRYPGEEGECHD